MAVPMKLVGVLSVAIPASGRLQMKGQQHLVTRAVAGGHDGVHYGDSRCPCIGFDNVEGETVFKLDHEEKEVDVSYPADIGARCKAWDDDRHPLCKAGEKPGRGEKWCAQSWCYVDPCNCNIDVLPKISTYDAEATYQGKPLFWSYATCGGKDMFTKKIPEVGRPKCRCIGFAGVAGTTDLTFRDGKEAEYPADMGTSCSAWDDFRHPECKGEHMPSWCKASWCYVDPCECDLPGELVPKISAYLPEATFTGKNLYYSYETCGSADTWTENNHHDACVNQHEEGDCGKLPRCAWTGSRCLGVELVDHPLCKEAALRVQKKLDNFEAHSGAMASSLLRTEVAILVASVAFMSAALA